MASETTSETTNTVEALPPARRTPATDDFPTGPSVGEHLPDFTLPDQTGAPVTFSRTALGSRAVVFFHRSAAWCPYCRTHLTSFQRHLEDFRAAGVQVFAISNDSVEVLERFARENGITYPLLSDADSAVIKRLGILNTLIAEDEDRYGIAYPGVYVVDESGVVVEKMFYREYAIRASAASVLRGALGLELSMDANPRADIDGPGVRISASLGEDALRFMQQTPLYIRLELDDGLHVYGEPVPDGFVPTTVQVTGPEGLRVLETATPRTRPYRIEGIADDFHVFEGLVEFTVPLVSAVRATEPITIDVTVRYQACDDRQCFLPQQRSLSLEVPLARLNMPQPQ